MAVEDAGRKLVQRKFSIVINNRMARITSALETNDNIGLGSFYISNFPLTFIAPVCAYDSFNHIFSLRRAATDPVIAALRRN